MVKPDAWLTCYLQVNRAPGLTRACIRADFIIPGQSNYMFMSVKLKVDLFYELHNSAKVLIKLNCMIEL